MHLSGAEFFSGQSKGVKNLFARFAADTDKGTPRGVDTIEDTEGLSFLDIGGEIGTRPISSDWSAGERCNGE